MVSLCHNFLNESMYIGSTSSQYIDFGIDPMCIEPTLDSYYDHTALILYILSYGLKPPPPYVNKIARTCIAKSP